MLSAINEIREREKKKKYMCMRLCYGYTFRGVINEAVLMVPKLWPETPALVCLS